MKNELGYQYDRCISRGICSINPTTASLQEVIILFLKNTAFYGLKLEDMGIKNQKIYNLVLNTMSVLNSGYEISVRNFEIIKYAFQTELPNIIKEYELECEKHQKYCEKPDISKILDKETEINEFIRLGEKEFNTRIQSSTAQILNLYRILFLITKSISVNLHACQSFGLDLHENISFILKILNILNLPPQNSEELKQLITEAAQKDCELITELRKTQEEKYGKQVQSEVSFSTSKGKAILVVGSNLHELELILEKLKDTNTDIYTHDNMMLAHTFPKFKEYKNLKGQYGQGMENCLLDFSTFPGPIILTSNSLFNVENFYRGRLFTTDFAYSKGVIPIKNNDFSEVIQSAEDSKGFKTGRSCTPEKLGFSYENAYKVINEKLTGNNYTQVIITGIRGFSQEENEYFQNLIKHAPDNILVISLSCCEEKANVLCFNAAYDNYAMLAITKYIIKNFSQKVNLFFPFCDRHTLSILIMLYSSGVNKIFAGSWSQTTLKPNILDGLKEFFGIFQISTPKKDLSLIENS